jgi:hypothetical protein
MRNIVPRRNVVARKQRGGGGRRSRFCAAANPGASSNLWELKAIANHKYGKYICSIIELSALLIEFLKRSTKDVSMPHEVQILTMQFRLR